MEEGPGPWWDGADGDRPRDGEEADVFDAEINHHHRGSADSKHKYNTLGYQRRTKQKVVTDFATVSKGTSAAARPRAALRQVLFNQGASADKNPALSEERGQLDVLKQDLEAFAVPVSLKWRWREESGGATLEKNWTDLVHSHETMSKTQRHQQEALWEFVHTELTYINKLIIIRDLVLAALHNLQQHSFLLEMNPQLLFSNLPSILGAHQLFWQEVMYPMLQEVRRTGQPFDPLRLEAGCLQFHERFPSYKLYCWEEEDNLEFTRRQMESNPHFLTYVQWVETHPQCERMRVGDMQAKPHQRITKYPLLLKAVLRNTQDLHVQHRLRGMLSSVNAFLESINDHLRLKDEELALSISAQRVEGYEVEGISEEIDKHVREICQFDLTCPVRGVGPRVVRKLLLEENLKIRDRKDNKLEVVSLLFSDVLLMTKVQKKGERLKVVRPPLALDRTSCMALRDGCSFVLVEVGELQSTMNVYIFTASTSESCSMWVSTILQAKEKLSNQRKMARNQQMENWRNQPDQPKPIKDATMDHARDETFVDQLNEDVVVPRTINGMLASKEAVAPYQYQPAEEVGPDNSDIPFWQPPPIGSSRKQGRKGSVDQGHVFKDYEWIEMGDRGNHTGRPREEESQLMMKERRVTFNHRAQSTPNLLSTTANDESFKYKSHGVPRLFVGGLPDVDYPTDEESTLPIMPRGAPGFQQLPGLSASRTDLGPPRQDMRRNSAYSQDGDSQTSPEVFRFPKIKSPMLQRRRPLSVHQRPLVHTAKPFSHSSGETWAGAHFSSSASDSEYSRGSKRNSLPSDSNSHRVLKLGSLKPNQGMFWSMYDRSSPDDQTLSEPEPEPSYRPQLKTQRSRSIPNFIFEGGHGLRHHHSSLYTLPQEPDVQFHPNGHHSPLEGLLERAKERLKERSMTVAHRRTRSSLSSPSFSTTRSLSPMDGSRRTEWGEAEVELMRHRALTVSKGWKEQLVDGDEDDNRNSVVFSEGVNVDWPGWCFDDEEVMDHLQPSDEGLLEGISRSLALLDIHRFSEPEEGECSQV